MRVRFYDDTMAGNPDRGSEMVNDCWCGYFSGMLDTHGFG